MVSAASSQYVLQYFSPFSTLQRHDGCAHIPSRLSAIMSLLPRIRAISGPGLNPRADKPSVKDLLANAQRIFETATSVAGEELESGELSILIGYDGAIRMVQCSDWPLDSLERRHGARAAYRVQRTAGQVRVEGKSGTASCLLKTDRTSAVARRLLADRPRYVLAA